MLAELLLKYVILGILQSCHLKENMRCKFALYFYRINVVKERCLSHVYDYYLPVVYPKYLDSFRNLHAWWFLSSI